jgi:hypothetical protein
LKVEPHQTLLFLINFFIRKSWTWILPTIHFHTFIICPQTLDLRGDMCLFTKAQLKFRIHLSCQDGKQWTNLNFNKVFSFKSPCFNELKTHLQSKATCASSRLVNPNPLIFLWMQQSC